MSYDIIYTFQSLFMIQKKNKIVFIYADVCLFCYCYCLQTCYVRDIDKEMKKKKKSFQTNKMKLHVDDEN